MGHLNSWPARPAATVAVAAAMLWAGPESASAQPYSADRPCAWTLAFDAASSNYLAPDMFAHYWLLPVPDTPGSSLTITGRYPHSRYISFVTYSPGTLAQGLNDQQIEPDSGSVDPFLPGANRNADNRNYTVRVISGPPPENPPPNTLYTGSAHRPTTVLYRIYRPDQGRDLTGGTGLPAVAVNLPGGAGQSESSCPTPPAENPDAIHPSPLPIPAPATPWRQSTVTADYGNPDNRYLTSVIALSAGQVAMIHAAMPTTPSTYPGTATMGTGQLRYWSLCAYTPYISSAIACAVDDQVPLDEHRQYTIMVSAPADRPADATLACGIVWLPSAGPATTLMLRNMLPDQRFRQSIQAAHPGLETTDMGPYYPTTHTLETTAAESLGCPAQHP